MSLKNQNETMKEKVRKAFSLKEDSAPHEEIKARLLDGGQVTGTNMCVLVCAMIIASVGLNMSSQCQCSHDLFPFISCQRANSGIACKNITNIF